MISCRDSNRKRSALAACDDDPQPPASCGSIGQLTIHAGESVTTMACFNDPNGDRLSYSATSSDLGVVAVRASDNNIISTGVAPGSATVSVTATDPGGLSATQSATVNVREAEERFRDDFDTPASLNRWLLDGATAVVREGLLELTSTDVVGIAERSVSAPLAPWTISVSMGRREAGGNSVGVWWLTGHARYERACRDLRRVARAEDDRAGQSGSAQQDRTVRLD